MKTEITALLPPATENLSADYNRHSQPLQHDAPVDMLPSLKDAPPQLKESVTAERERRVAENARNLGTILNLREALEKAKIDPVTGLRNRAAFEEEVPTIFERSNPGELTMLYFDLNGLKRANNLGHDIGDNYLKTVASTIQTGFRPTDLVYRVGGDEIVAVLGGKIDEEILPELGNRVKTAVDESIIQQGLPENLYLGVSVGGAVKHENESLDQYSRRADMACEADKLAFYQKIEQETGQNLRR